MKKTFLFFAALFAALVSFTLTSCDGNDPEGVITVKMRNYSEGDTRIYLDGYYLMITSANNFYFSGGEICDAGAKKLGAVKTVPSSGWTQELAVIPGHTYVLRRGESKYYKLYVIDWINGASSGGIIGAEVKYCEWTPNI